MQFQHKDLQQRIIPGRQTQALAKNSSKLNKRTIKHLFFKLIFIVILYSNLT